MEQFYKVARPTYAVADSLQTLSFVSTVEAIERRGLGSAFFESRFLALVGDLIVVYHTIYITV